jgi:hypothetical protein
MLLPEVAKLLSPPATVVGFCREDVGFVEVESDLAQWRVATGIWHSEEPISGSY